MRKKGIFYGWWILLSTSVIHFWGAGVFVYSFTAFFNPLVRDFHWSYAATSFTASFRSLESGIAAPVVGFLTDKFGARRLMIIGAAWAGIGFMLLSQINSLWSFYATFIFLSIGMSMMLPVPGWTIINNWFSRKRGTAMGVVNAAVGASGVLIPLVNWLITQYGWRATFTIAGIGMWVIGIPLSLIIRHRPEQYGYLPDGEEHLMKEPQTPARQKQPRLNEEATGFGVKQAIKTRAFWILALTVTSSGAALHAVALHVMPALISVQMPRELASSIAALVVLSSIAGRMGFGWLGDRLDKKYLLASSLLLQALGLIIFAYTRSLAYAIAFLALFGPGWGGVSTLRLTIQGEYFGRKSFGSIQGLMLGIGMVGTILGPVFAGWIYDIQSSYQLAWLTLAIIVFFSIPLTLTIKPPKEQVTPSI
ncbi:MFS transporter [Chloroflexota bacterium]